MSFYSERIVKKTRKAHRCFGCGRWIDVGISALKCAGVSDGDFFDGYYHHECREAEVALNKTSRFIGWDWCNLIDIEDEDFAWLKIEHPLVFRRLTSVAEVPK